MAKMTFTADDEDAYIARRDELVHDFETWVHGSGSPDFADAHDFGTLLDWKWGYGDGRLDSWHRHEIEEFLLDWCPRKLAVPADLVRGIPSAVTLAMSFLATHKLLAARSDPIQRLTDFTMGLQGRFMEAMDNPANFGIGKSLLGGLGIDDFSSLDPGQLEEAIEAFNALPHEERLRLTGGQDSGGPLPTVGPILMPEASAVRASAAQAPMIAKFEQLNDYFASPGRALTTAGNIKLADARELAAILATGDIFEQEIGDKVWHKRSATRLVQLDHWQWWAREAGALQRRGTKLVGVKAWRQRLGKDPIAQVARAFEALLDHGVLASFRPWMYTPLMQVLDESVGPLLGLLLDSSAPAEYDELLDSWAAMVSQVGVSEYYPREVDHAFDELIGLLERAGIITQEGEVRTPSEWSGSDRSGGTLTLTPVGIVLAVDLIRTQGITVEEFPVPESMDASDLAALAVDSGLDPVAWWDLTIGWLDLQADQETAFGNLVVELNTRGPVSLIIALASMPESAFARTVSLLRDLAVSSDPPPGEIGSAATIFLLQTGQLAEQDVDPDRRMDALLVTLGALAEEDVSADEAMELPDDVGTVLELIAEAGRRLPPRVVVLLEAIGREYPNKVVAKAARKELFRVRSKLAAL